MFPTLARLKSLLPEFLHPLPLSDKPANGDKIGKLLDRLGFERMDISREGEEVPYLVRWSILGSSIHRTQRAAYVHRVRRDDLDTLHDHPWAYTSLILSGGYWEVTPGPGWHRDGQGEQRTWHGPWSLLRRPADWIHRIELPPGKECWTLVVRGRRERGWGFWCPKEIGPPRFVDWRQHASRTRSLGSGCAT